MHSRAKLTAIKVLAAILAGFLAFCVSVILWGSWWRFPDMPTAEEWSALFGASALVALLFAWYQIRQVDQSNLSLIASNELARQVNLEAVRPRVQVALQTNIIVLKNRGGAARATLHIAVSNIGVSPAQKVRLKVTPPFASLDEFFKPGMMGVHFAEVNRAFDGTVHYETLSPGNTYLWFLGRAPELFEPAEDIPRRWEIEAEYFGSASDSPFRDSFVIDLNVEKRIDLPVDSLTRIGKDIEVVGDHLASIKKTIPGSLTLSGETIAALRNDRSTARFKSSIRTLGKGRRNTQE